MYQFLRLRRANERTIDISSSKADELLGDDLLTFKGEDKLWDSKLARKPLSASQTETLVKAAIELHARANAVNFYAKYAYRIVGDEFEEVGIPHFKMIKRLMQF
jgi:predicted GNAT family N-acyltransferase